MCFKNGGLEGGRGPRSSPWGSAGLLCTFLSLGVLEPFMKCSCKFKIDPHPPETFDILLVTPVSCLGFLLLLLFSVGCFLILFGNSSVAILETFLPLNPAWGIS